MQSLPGSHQSFTSRYYFFGVLLQGKMPSLLILIREHRNLSDYLFGAGFKKKNLAKILQNFYQGCQLRAQTRIIRWLR